MINDCSSRPSNPTISELGVFHPILNFLQRPHPLFKDRIKQLPEFAEARLSHGSQRLEWLDSILAKRQLVAGEQYTIADFTPQVGIDIGTAMGGLTLPAGARHLKRWHEEVSSRPSAKA